MPSSSRSAPSSRACGSMSLSVRRMSWATGTRFLPARGEVHHRRLEAVARAEPLVLGDEDAVERGQLRARVEALGVVLHEGLHVGGEGDRLLHAA